MLLNTLKTNNVNRFQVWELSEVMLNSVTLAFVVLSLGVLDTFLMTTSFIHFTIIKNSPRVLWPLPQPRYDEAVLKVECFPCA